MTIEHGQTAPTVAEWRRRQNQREITSVQLVQMFLDRIEALDRSGPQLHAVFTLNPRAMEDAAALDEALRKRSRLVGPLHGIPVAIKDQIETEGIATSFGCAAFKDYIPKQDATLVKRLRESGAVILAKTAMPDLAASFFTFSSLGPQPKNPYDLDRNPGGSSGGTAAAVAANLVVVGVGEDTGGSVRVPAAFNGIVGIRVTTGLISRTGMSPLIRVMDTPGPMTRSVEDAALLLDVLVGYDPADDFTVASRFKPRTGYSAYLKPGALKGSHIGVVRTVFGPGTDPESAAVNDAVATGLRVIEGAGARLADVDIPGLDDFLAATSLYGLVSKHEIDSFLAERRELPLRSFDSIYQSRSYHPLLDLMDVIAGAPDHPELDLQYWRALAIRENFQRAILNIMAAKSLIALVYPTVRVLPPLNAELEAGRWSTLTFPTNTLIASQAGLPAVSICVGLTSQGLPVGLELLGRPYDEATLVGLAYSLEQLLPRTAPPAIFGL